MSKPKQVPGLVEEYLVDRDGELKLDKDGRPIRRIRPNRKASRMQKAELRRKNKHATR